MRPEPTQKVHGTSWHKRSRARAIFVSDPTCVVTAALLLCRQDCESSHVHPPMHCICQCPTSLLGLFQQGQQILEDVKRVTIDYNALTFAWLCRRPKLTRETFKNSFRRFWAVGSKAATLCDAPGPLCFAVIRAKDAEQVPLSFFFAPPRVSPSPCPLPSLPRLGGDRMLRCMIGARAVA